MDIPRKRVLVVDDDELSGKLYNELLRSAGFEMLFAYDAEDAFPAREEDRRTDPIIADVVMPFMDGFEFTRRLKNDLLTRDIPVIGTSAYYDRTENGDDRELAVDGFIVKPVERKRFMQEIDRALNNRQAIRLTGGREKA